MAKRANSQAISDTKTLASFAHEVIAGLPQQGILDATSLGIFSIAEQSGLLSGEWKRHRNLMQDLDLEKVAGALGELLAAIAQTAHAVGISLDAVMTQHLDRLQTVGSTPARQRKTLTSAAPLQSGTPGSAPRCRQISQTRTGSGEDPRPGAAATRSARPRNRATPSAPTPSESDAARLGRPPQRRQPAGVAQTTLFSDTSSATPARQRRTTRARSVTVGDER